LVKYKGKVVPAQAMKVYEIAKMYIQLFLPSLPDRGERTVSSPIHLTSRAHSIKGWVGPYSRSGHFVVQDNALHPTGTETWFLIFPVLFMIWYSFRAWWTGEYSAMNLRQEIQ